MMMTGSSLTIKILIHVRITEELIDISLSQSGTFDSFTIRHFQPFYYPAPPFLPLFYPVLLSLPSSGPLIIHCQFILLIPIWHFHPFSIRRNPLSIFSIQCSQPVQLPVFSSLLPSDTFIESDHFESDHENHQSPSFLVDQRAKSL